MPEMWNFEFFCVLCPIFSHPSAVCHTGGCIKNGWG